MKLKLNNEHLSLKEFESEEMPDFVVITGRNGSGKTQLLQALQTHPKNFEFTPQITDIRGDAIDVRQFHTITTESVNSQKKSLTDQWRNIPKPLMVLYSKLEEVGLSIHSSVNDLKDSQTPQGYSEIIEVAFKAWNSFAQVTSDQVDLLWEKVSSSLKSNERLFKLASEISKYYDKPISSLRESDFNNFPMTEEFVDSPTLFQSSLDLNFHVYLQKRNRNEYDYFRKERLRQQNNSIHPEEFNERFPPPWRLFNSVLEDYGVAYRISDHDPDDFHPDQASGFYFVNENSQPISSEQFSSGEKIVIGLLTKLFTSQLYSDALTVPEMFVADEPDAYLHPDNTRVLLDILNGTFVKKLGMKVIITTHSPSTIALCPENSIFELKNRPISSLKKISKDYALEILTGNIPNLSISYQNHRQVLVESPTDVKYYQVAYNKIKEHQMLKHDLYFLSYGYGKSNKSQVVKTVKDFREAGNKTVYGIIDWDNSSKASKEIQVHGEGSRYTIENYLLDPVYLGLMLWDKEFKDFNKDMSFQPVDDLFEILKKENKKIQAIADWICKKFIERFPHYKDSKMTTFQYQNGYEITVPDWYKTEGKDLVEKFKELFPILDSKKYESLKTLAKYMGRSYPLMPIETYNLILDLGN